MQKILILLLIWLVPCISFAQEKTFPIGKAIATKAMMCFDDKSALVIAKLRTNQHPIVGLLIQQGKCVMITGVATYTKRVHEEDGWDVWEVHFGETILYEATDWKPPSV